VYEAVKERGSRAFFAVVALVPAGSAKVEKQESAAIYRPPVVVLHGILAAFGNIPLLIIIETLRVTKNIYIYIYGKIRNYTPSHVTMTIAARSSKANVDVVKATLKCKKPLSL
jgi:hypothetical protein